MTRISRVGAGKKGKQQFCLGMGVGEQLGKGEMKAGKGKQQFCLGMGVGEQLGKGEMSAEKRDATAQKNGMQLIDGEWGGN